uniref:Uncharacterized protein n=1 Tax=Utricularia reniformis TaxID=192314 RepID=A0A1Y0B0G7_9LAMI|nr:hypothetical protein AEK19_MT0684 [Utricularia reniformis]ART30932.1 hypothetical protein AEK19_MT0684 [Utricularia reniformis]
MEPNEYKSVQLAAAITACALIHRVNPHISQERIATTQTQTPLWLVNHYQGNVIAPQLY